MTKALPLVFICCWFCGFAQTPDWVWARYAHVSIVGDGESSDIAVDRNDNVFITGYFIDSVSFGSYSLSTSSEGAYLAKYDAAGNIKWAKSNTSSSNSVYCIPNSVCTDKSGNSYITGSFDDIVSFGAFTLPGIGNTNIFLVKYDSTGNVQWAKSAGINDDGSGFGVAADASGNIYVTGSFDSPTITFGGYTLTNAGGANVFLVKYNTAGNVLWARSSSCTGGAGGWSVSTDASHNVYVTGYYGSANISFGSTTLTNTGSEDIFLAKYDSSGNVLWARSANGSGYNGGLCVAADSMRNEYLTGYFTSPSLSFGSHIITNAGYYDGFIAKYDSSGNALWAKDIGGAGYIEGYSLSADKYGKVYFTGRFDTAPVTFDTITLPMPNNSLNPMYLFCSDSSGHSLWGKALASGGEWKNAVATAPSGCIYIGGHFQTPTLVLGNDTMYYTGTKGVPFVAKLCNSGLSSYFTSSANIFCSEPVHCINFFDQSFGNPTSWRWTFTGAFPDTSSLQNPTSICYSTPGTYPVSLIVSDGTSIDTLTVASMIIVGGTPPLPVISVVGGDTLVSSSAAHYQWYLNGNIISGATDSFYVEHQNGTYSVQITDGYGCQAVSGGMNVGVDELSGGSGIVVYPNPVSDQFTVYGLRFTVGETLEVYDVVGKKVLALQSEINNPKSEMRVDVSSLAKGLYWIQISDGEKVYRAKFVKE